MPKLLRLALLFAFVAIVLACGSYEQRKQSVVRAVTATVFRKFVSVQRCATLTQSTVKEPSSQRAAAKMTPAPVAAPVRSCHLSTRALLFGSRAWLSTTIRAAELTVCGS